MGGPLLNEHNTLRNTVLMLGSYIAEVEAFADRLLAGKMFPPQAESELVQLKNQFLAAHIALWAHRREGSIDLATYDYLMAAAYAGEIPAYLAVAEARLRAAKGDDRVRAWERIRAKQLPLVLKFIRKAQGRLKRARQDIGLYRWMLTLLRVAWNARRERWFGGRDQEPRAAGPPDGHGARPRRRLSPLGYGDLTFQLSTAGAAAQQLYKLGDMAVILFTDDDEDLIGNDSGSLVSARDFLDRLLDGESRPRAAGPLLVAAGTALVNAELTLGRHRLSRITQLAKAKIYLLRAAVCLGHIWSVDRSQTVECIVYPAGRKQEAQTEQKVALLMARSYANTARTLAEEVRSAWSLWWHHVRWGLVADLSPDLGRCDVLPNHDLTNTLQMIYLVDGHVRRAEAESVRLK